VDKSKFADMKLRRLALLVLFLLPCPAQAQACEGQQVVYEGDLSVLRGGYCQMGLRIPGLVSKRTYFTTPPQFFSTRALYQAEGVMEETARSKGYDGLEDYVALMPPMMDGAHAFIQPPNTGYWIPVRVVDAVKRQDYYLETVWMSSGIELSYSLAERLGVIGMTNENGDRYMWGLKVCIANEHPDDVCTGEPVDYTAWFRTILSFDEG
jgi:hypothetical protein